MIENLGNYPGYTGIPNDTPGEKRERETRGNVRLTRFTLIGLAQAEFPL